MRLREIFLYEIEHRLRSKSTWAYLGFLFLLAMWMFLATSDGGGIAHVNAPQRLAGGSALAGTAGLIVTAALFGDAAVRDVAAGMDPFLFTSPLRKIDYLGGRFLAALAVNAVALAVVPLAFLAATRLSGPFGSEWVSPFRVGAYLLPYPLFLLPNLVLGGSILYAVGVLTRHVVPVYLAALGLFLACIVAMNVLGPIENPVLAVLGDPLGMRTLQDSTRYWTESERNVRLIGLSAGLAWNRVFWLGVAAGVLALLHRSFRFSHDGASGRKNRSRRANGEAFADRPRPLAVPRVAGSFGLWTTARQTLAVTRRSLTQVIASRWYAVVLLACTGLTLLMGWNVGDTVFDTSTWPVTLLVAGTVLAERVVPILYALIALYAGELVWQDRESNVDEIADAAPVPEGVALLGRFLALVALIVTFQVALMVGGILIQTLQGYTRLEIGLYLQVLFGLKLADYLLFAVLATTIQVVVDHKYLGHVVVLLACASAMALRMLGIVDHHLLLYGTDPGWTYSDMNGFGPFLRPFVWFKLYWASWALLLAVVAMLFWVRGRESGFRHRLLIARRRLRGPVARAAAAALVLILVLGGFVFVNTNVLNEYRGPNARGAPQAEYERRYKRFEHLPQPTLADADLRIEILPHEPAADLTGSFRLENRTGLPIDSVHVFLADRDVEVRAISLQGAGQPLVDDEARYSVYPLEPALEPGDCVQLAFDVSLRPRGFRNDASRTDVVANGTTFNRRLLPLIGYQPLFELADDEERRRFGLEPRRPLPSADEPGATRSRWPIQNEDLVQVTAVLGTSVDQIAVLTPGVLRRTWIENGRRYFHYETEEPAGFGGTVFSGEYELLEDRWEGVALRILHHATHDDNLDRMLRGMKASLAYYTEQFGAYPSEHLSIVEIPRYGGFGAAHPDVISFTEDAVLSRVREGEVDQPFYGTAHEVAHTWWGGQVRGALARGSKFLSESLANYSAMMVVEKTYGPEAARRVYHFQMERYLRGRAMQSREVPLLEVEDQPYIAYRKGAIAMYTLREHLGEEAVNGALRRYVERYRDAGPPYPTSLDLYAELRAAAPDSLQGLLRDLFEEVTLWDVRTERAVVEPTPTGEFQVTLDVVAKKVRADDVGAETEVPMDDLVEVGVFAPDDEQGPGVPLHLERHRVRSGEQTIRITVPREPARAGIDPHRKLIDRNGDDNVVALAPAERR